MERVKEAMKRVLASDAYDIRKDGTVHTLINLGGHIGTTWRRFDRTRKGRQFIRATDTYLSVSRLVYTKYKGEIPSGMVVDHIDEDGKNNHIDNLQLLTQKENMSKSFYTNPLRRLKKSEDYIYNHKFCRRDIVKIRYQRDVNKLSYREIGRMYNTSKGHISDICNKKIWKHV